MEYFEYFVNGKRQKVLVKICKSFFSKVLGLMFRRNSPPLLFIFPKNQKILIHSFFCRPFTAIWLDDKKHATKIETVRPWQICLSGKGKYLLEIPKTVKFPTEIKKS